MIAAEPINRPADAPVMDQFRGDRVYLGADHARNERRAWLVTGICAATLMAQLAGGLLFRSMALTASGLHMAAHVAALLTASVAYALARRYAQDPRFSFGTGKIGYLAGFANAVILAVTALAIGAESVKRLISPAEVHYEGALPLAAAGLAITLLCVWLLKPLPRQHEDHDPQGDLNLSAAHLHLWADALVSVLALAGLAAGRSLGWAWTDPLAGLLGAALVAHFAWRLLTRAGSALLDVNPSARLTAEVRERLESQGERVLDLHLWRLGPGHHAAIAVIAAADPRPPETYRARLAGLRGLSHVTIEVRPADPVRALTSRGPRV